MFNGKSLQGAKDPLLVKFADGGNKKKSLFKSTIWRETGEVRILLSFLMNKKIIYYKLCISIYGHDIYDIYCVKLIDKLNYPYIFIFVNNKRIHKDHINYVIPNMTYI